MTGGPAAGPPDTCVLSLRDIAKTFGGARALKGIGLDVRRGEIHGLLGQNGSGKSTLVKILSGFHAPDPGGRMLFNGESVDLPMKAGVFRRLGMSFVHQNLGLVGSLTVLENLRLAELTLGRRGFIDWRAERAAARRALDRFGIDLDPSERADRLSPVDRALLAIVRAFEDGRMAEGATGRPGLVLLDEPTPFLPREGVEKLFGLMRSIAAHGSSILFISHDIDEVIEITDRLTVLRDGEVAGELVTRDATREEVVERIVGRRIVRDDVARPAKAGIGAPFLGLRGVAGRTLEPLDLDLAAGEVLGLTGLIGSGYEELPYLIFGARRPRSGTMTFGAGPILDLRRMTPRRAIGLGLALLPGDRQAASGVDTLSVADNLFVPDMGRFVRHGVLDHRRMSREARTICTRFEIRPNDPALQLKALSGGNAQKVLIARWMSRAPRLLLLDEPTQGVDVGTRQQISAAIRDAAAQGMGVICASSDAEQLADICDRVLILAQGLVVAEVAAGAVTKDAIAEACYASAALAPGGACETEPTQPVAS